MGFNTDSQLDSVQSVRDFEGVAVLNGVSSPSPSPQGSGIYLEEEVAKLWEPEMAMAPRKTCLPDTAGLMHIWIHWNWQCVQDLHRLTEKKSRHWERKVDTQSPNQVAIGNWSLLGKETPVSSNEVSLVYQPHSRAGLVSRSTWPTQNSLHGFCVVFVLFWLLFCFVLFYCFLFVCLIFLPSLLFFWDREREREI